MKARERRGIGENWNERKRKQGPGRNNGVVAMKSDEQWRRSNYSRHSRRRGRQRANNFFNAATSVTKWSSRVSPELRENSSSNTPTLKIRYIVSRKKAASEYVDV